MPFGALAEQFLDAYGLLAVFVIMLLKEIGVPLPIPSDLIMLGAAARAAQGKFPIFAVFFAILIPMVVGGLVQYFIAKGPGRRVVYRLGSYIGLTKARLDRAMETVRRGGPVAVGVGLTTPGVRIAIVPASGLAELRLGAFVPGLVVGSTFFLGWHFAIGYLGGFVLSLLNLPLPTLVGVVVAVLAVGIIGWLAVRRISRGRDRTRGPGEPLAAPEQITLSERYAAWADASCPACIAITLIRQQEPAQQ
jgi:membrane protein DedA with SNARE-associated domain